MASLQLLALELSKAFVLYRQPRPAQAEFELLVRTWGDVLADVSDAEFRERTPAVNREALPENALTLDERCELGTDWCAKILANLRCKMDARRQGRPDTPLDEQLANLRALGVEQ